MDKRNKFIRYKLLMLKATTTHTLRTIKEERFTIEDEKDCFKNDFLNDSCDDFGFLMTVTTRSKIHTLSYRIFQMIRDWLLPYDHDVDRLLKLIRVHITQLHKMNASHININKKFYFDMYDSIEQNVRWLKILKLGQ